jgi:hypothetical protein
MSGESKNTDKVAIQSGQLVVKLRRLWKGTLFTAIGGLYIALAGALFLNDGWLTLLLTVFLVGIGQFFRYVANDVDHIGWLLRSNQVQGNDSEAKTYQRRLVVFLFACIQLLNLGVALRVFVTTSWQLAVIVIVALTAVESLYFYVRMINRRIEFKSVSYGYSDGAILSSGPDRSHPEEYAQRKRTRSLEEKLEALKEMVEKGEISEAAYLRVRDEQLIQKMMKD